MSVLSSEQLLASYGSVVKDLQKKVSSETKKEEWLLSRRGKITGSVAHKLFTAKLQTSSGETAKNFILEKVAESFGSYNLSWGSAATNWGNDHEVEAVEEYMKQTGNEVTKYGEDQEFVQYDDYCGATPDGLINDTGTLQIKCPYNPAYHVKNLLIENVEQFKQEQPSYYIQVQMEMLCTNRDWCHFVSYDPRNKNHNLSILLIPKCDQFQVILKAALKRASIEIQEKIEKIKKRIG